MTYNELLKQNARLQRENELMTRRYLAVIRAYFDMLKYRA